MTDFANFTSQDQLPTRADAVICGAGMAGLAAAYFLAARRGMRRVVLVDERPPFSLTSDKSTEAYRNFWPGADDAMIGLMNRSITLLEELAEASGEVFQLNRRGYAYVTADPAQAEALRRTALQAQAQGAGPLRVHGGGADAATAYQPAPAEGWRGQPDGADLLLDLPLIRAHFPYLSESAIAVLHTRRCGWFSGQQLGMVLLEQARAAGAVVLRGRVEGVELRGGRVQGVSLAGAGGSSRIAAPVFINAAGPFLKPVGALLGVDLPVFNERHIKASIQDSRGVLPRHAPLLIWTDPQRLPWTDEERADLAASPETAWLLGDFPAGAHTRPEGGPGSQNILLLWDYHLEPVEPVFPVPEKPFFTEVALRGLAALLPGLRLYFERLPRPWLDGGYYTKTVENRLLSGPLPVEGAYVLGALSGFGLMAGLGAADLLAAHITGGGLPDYTPAFSLARYADPAYRRRLEDWGPSGQL